MVRFTALILALGLGATLCAAGPVPKRDEIHPVHETAAQVLMWLDTNPRCISERMIDDFRATLKRYPTPVTSMDKVMAEAMLIGAEELSPYAKTRSQAPWHAEALLKKDPNSLLLLNNAAWCTYLAGDMEAASRLAKKLNREGGARDRRMMLDTLAMIALAEGRPVRAMHRMIRALELSVSDKRLDDGIRMVYFAHAAEVFFANKLIVPAYWCWTLADNLRTKLLMSDDLSGDAELSAVCTLDTALMHRKAKAIAALVAKLRKESRLQMPPAEPYGIGL